MFSKRVFASLILGVALGCAPGFSQGRMAVPHARPQVMPMPQANPQPAQVQYPPYPGPGPVSIPQQPPVSNACYVTLAPPSGCYIAGAGPIGAPCYCVDVYSNVVGGVLQ